MSVVVRWPDGQERDYYSPSLVVHEHLTAGTRYRVAEFEERAVRALAIASDRVLAIRGFRCTAAAASATEIARTAARFGTDDLVEVVRLWPPMTQETR